MSTSLSATPRLCSRLLPELIIIVTVEQVMGQEEAVVNAADLGQTRDQATAEEELSSVMFSTLCILVTLTMVTTMMVEQGVVVEAVVTKLVRLQCQQIRNVFLIILRRIVILTSNTIYRSVES